MKKMIATVLCSVIMLLTLAVPAFAVSEEISPYFNNVKMTTTDFYIDSDGTGFVVVSYEGEQGVTTGATIKIKIQKRSWLFFWNDVDIGVSNNTWVDVVSSYHYAAEHTFELGSGTYKAIVEYTIYGYAGDPDVITDEIERSN